MSFNLCARYKSLKEPVGQAADYIIHTELNANTRELDILLKKMAHIRSNVSHFSITDILLIISAECAADKFQYIR